MTGSDYETKVCGKCGAESPGADCPRCGAVVAQPVWFADPESAPSCVWLSLYLSHAVTGLAGAATYETRLGPGSGRAAFYLQSLSLTHLAAAGLMVIGAVVFVLGSKGR